MTVLPNKKRSSCSRLEKTIDVKKLKLFNKLAFLFNSIAAALLLLSYVIPSIAPKSFALISVLSLAVPILIIINILFFIYWLLKVKKQLLLSLVVLTIGYKYLGSMYKFSSSLDVDDENNISVMSYNVRLFNVYDWLSEDNVPAKINAFIEAQQPDIVSFQEYKKNSEVPLDSYPYKYEQLSDQDGEIGQVIASKFPIVNSGSIEFPNTHNNAIFIDVVNKKDTLRIYNIHLQSLRISADVAKLKTENSDIIVKKTSETFKIQQEQAELFLKHRSTSSYKTIITGDFNNTAYSYVYKEIKGVMNDGFEMAGNGFGRTFDFKFFPIRIDFIFSDNDFKVNGFKTFEEKYSDHYPIMATLSLH